MQEESPGQKGWVEKGMVCHDSFGVHFGHHERNMWVSPHVLPLLV